MSRIEALKMTGNVPTNPTSIDSILEECYKNEEKQIWEQDLFSSPHGTHWATSFHASQFPGDENACARKAMYGFMNIPGPKPMIRKVRASAESGQDIEDRLVWRFHRAGILLSEPPSSEHQTNFQKPEIWLSGSSDAIIQKPRENKPHCIEIKTKYQKVIDQMKAGEKSYDPQHYNQLMTYMSLCREKQHEFWPDLELCDQGTLVYASRDDHSQIYEFTFNYDEDWWKNGVKTLEEWQEEFLYGRLPERPEHFMWSKGPCQYCPFKKHACKPDFQDGITELKNSHGIEWAKEVYGEYDYQEQRNKTLERWNADDKSN